MSLWRSLELVWEAHKHLLRQLGVLFWAPCPHWWCSALWWFCSPHGGVTGSRKHPGIQLAIEWLVVGWLSCVLLLWLVVVWLGVRRGRLPGGRLPGDKLPLLVVMKLVATRVQMTVNLLVFWMSERRQTKYIHYIHVHTCRSILEIYIYVAVPCRN